MTKKESSSEHLKLTKASSSCADNYYNAQLTVLVGLLGKLSC